jgi:hypothetical protein
MALGGRRILGGLGRLTGCQVIVRIRKMGNPGRTP